MSESISISDTCGAFLKELYELKDADRMKLKTLTVPLPQNEKARIELLRQAHIFDSEPDASFDRCTRLASKVLNVPICLISLMDIDRQWFKSRVGLDVPETHRNVAFCSYTILETTTPCMIVPNALEDPRFDQNPLVLGFPNIRFYAGASIVVNKLKIGTLCIIDSKPRYNFSKHDEEILIGITNIIADLIAARRLEVLEIENDLARIMANVLQLIRRPLKTLTNSYESILTPWHNYCSYCQEKQEEEEKEKDDPKNQIQIHCNHPSSVKLFSSDFFQELLCFHQDLHALNEQLNNSLNVTLRMIYNNHNQNDHMMICGPDSDGTNDNDTTTMSFLENIQTMIILNHMDLNLSISTLLTTKYGDIYANKNIYQSYFIDENDTFAFLSTPTTTTNATNATNTTAITSLYQCYSHSDMILVLIDAMLSYCQGNHYHIYQIISYLNTEELFHVFQDHTQVKDDDKQVENDEKNGLHAMITYFTIDFLFEKHNKMFLDHTGNDLLSFQWIDELDAIQSLLHWIGGNCQLLATPCSDQKTPILLRMNIPCCIVTDQPYQPPIPPPVTTIITNEEVNEVIQDVNDGIQEDIEGIKEGMECIQGGIKEGINGIVDDDEEEEHLKDDDLINADYFLTSTRFPTNNTTLLLDTNSFDPDHTASNTGFEGIEDELSLNKSLLLKAKKPSSSSIHSTTTNTTNNTTIPPPLSPSLSLLNRMILTTTSSGKMTTSTNSSFRNNGTNSNSSGGGSKYTPSTSSLDANDKEEVIHIHNTQPQPTQPQQQPLHSNTNTPFLLHPSQLTANFLSSIRKMFSGYRIEQSQSLHVRKNSMVVVNKQPSHTSLNTLTPTPANQPLLDTTNTNTNNTNNTNSNVAANPFIGTIRSAHSCSHIHTHPIHHHTPQHTHYSHHTTTTTTTTTTNTNSHNNSVVPQKKDELDQPIVSSIRIRSNANTNTTTNTNTNDGNRKIIPVYHDDT